MMKKSINKIVCSAVLLFVAMAGFGQQTVQSQLQVCDDEILPVKLEDVVGLGLSAGGGNWYEVSDVTDQSQLIPENSTSNVFVGLNRLPGEYYFVFVPDNNPCLDDDDRAEVTISILETPKPITHFVNLCEGESINLDLASLVSESLKNNYTVTYKNTDGSALGNSELTFSSEGEYIYSYSINNDGLCTDSASIVVSVVNNETIAAIDFTDSLSFCQSAVPEYINLNEELGLTGNSGSWSGESAAPAITNGVVDLSSAGLGTYVYTHSWEDCDGTTQSKTFTLLIVDDLTPAFNDAETFVCKSISPNRKIDLMDLIEINIPKKSGVWTMESMAEGSAVDVTDGYFELADARAGQYVTRFTVSNAIDICGIEGQSVTVTLNIFDSGDVLDGEVQLCKANLVSGSTLDLNAHMQILPAGGTWYYNGSAISGSLINTDVLEIGVYQYEYVFNNGPCGEGSAILFVTVTDVLTNFKDKTKSFCLTDVGADQINLVRELGVGNVNGTWVNTNSAANYNSTNHVFNGRAEGIGTYKFTFTATDDACGISAGEQAVITIIITEDLVN